MALSPDEQRRLQRAREGEGRERDEALTALIADFRRPAIATIQRVLAGTVAGPQQAQEAWSRAVFRSLSRGVDAHADRATPRSYFVRVAINAAIDELRRLGRETQAIELPHDDTPASLLERREEQARLVERIDALRRCIDALPEPYRLPVDLYYLQQAGSCARCAELLELRTQTFMQRLSRARRKLIDYIGRSERP